MKLKEGLILVSALAVWLAVTGLCVGLRPEHGVLALLVAGLFVASGATRRLVVALLPFVVFGVSYDWMNIVHNYEVSAVDIGGIYGTEKSLFGILTPEGVVTPNEFCAAHTRWWLDLLGGIFYLCWVPVPILFGLWLYFKGKEEAYLHFALVFLLVNFIGFAGYYIHPAAPPWYVAQHGMEFDLGVGGNTAGLGAFDRLTGVGIFEGLYGRNSNVFAAVPSLHSAYTLVALIYAVSTKGVPGWIRVALGVITLGIWCTAVYTSHHYVIDVLLGIACAIVGWIFFEQVLMRLRPFARFIEAYAKYIAPGR